MAETLKLGDLAQEVERAERDLAEARESIPEDRRRPLRGDPSGWPDDHKKLLLTWIELWETILPEYTRQLAGRRGRTLGKEEVRQLWAMLTKLLDGMYKHVFAGDSLLGDLSPPHQQGAALESPGFLDSWDTLMSLVNPLYMYLNAPERERDPPGLEDEERMDRASRQIRPRLAPFLTTALEELDEVAKLVDPGRHGSSSA